MIDRFPGDRDAVLRTAEIAAGLTFDLTEELGYRYPDFSDGFETPDGQLREVCLNAFEGRRYRTSRHRNRAKARLRRARPHLGATGSSGFFLLHWEVLELARDVAAEVRGPGSPRHALPPGRGRGSSVGSIVCYLTGLSHVDPVEANLSLGRFLNRELHSAPDIDLDFPRDIREKLIVRVTERYGREHAALVAAFPTYHSRGAGSETWGRRSGCPRGEEELERLARVTEGNPQRVAEEVARLPGDHASPRWQALRVARPRDRRPAAAPSSQHSGRDDHRQPPASIELVPDCRRRRWKAARSASGTRTRCADAGFLKLDLLGLGMLSAVDQTNASA